MNCMAVFAGLMLGTAVVQADPEQSLSVKVDGRWQTVWRADSAPARWIAPSLLLERATRWSALDQHAEVAELELRTAQAGSARVVTVRIDPRRYRFKLEASVGASANWSVEQAGVSSVLALSAGQLAGVSPWGWVVHGGREVRPPAADPRSSAVVFEKNGAFTIVDAVQLREVRTAGYAYEAVQSYPTLLSGDGDLPADLRGAGDGKRAPQLVIGETRDGDLLIVHTRSHFTLKETAALMGALGARRAVAFDGGPSSQLLVRNRDGRVRAWRGQRKVPMGLVAVRAGN